MTKRDGGPAFPTLIEKLERATEGSRELDAEIALAIGIPFKVRRGIDGGSKGRMWSWDSHGGVETWDKHPPAFTTSLDVALSLVPKGWAWGVHIDPAWGALKAFVEKDIESARFWASADGNAHKQAATAPLALVLAALKARSQTP